MTFNHNLSSHPGSSRNKQVGSQASQAPKNSYFKCLKYHCGRLRQRFNAPVPTARHLYFVLTQRLHRPTTMYVVIFLDQALYLCAYLALSLLSHGFIVTVTDYSQKLFATMSAFLRTSSHFFRRPSVPRQFPTTGF